MMLHTCGYIYSNVPRVTNSCVVALFFWLFNKRIMKSMSHEIENSVSNLGFHAGVENPLIDSFVLWSNLTGEG